MEIEKFTSLSASVLDELNEERNELKIHSMEEFENYLSIKNMKKNMEMTLQNIILIIT